MNKERENLYYGIFIGTVTDFVAHHLAGLLEDAKLGNIETVEKLWDRIFGKAGQVTLELPQASQTANGIIPNTVVSREAYMIIRDTIIGKD